MKILTARDLTALVGMNEKRFDSLRRRYRESFHDRMKKDVVTHDESFPLFPTNEDEWQTVDRANARWLYDYQDALRLACVLEFEKQGLSFECATRIIVSTASPADFAMHEDGDYWIGRQYFGVAWGAREPIWPFVSGSIQRVFCPEYSEPEMASVVARNASLVDRRLRIRCAEMKLSVTGWEFTPTGKSEVTIVGGGKK